MLHQVISADDRPVGERFEWWRAELAQIGVDTAPPACLPPEDFRAAIGRRAAPALTHMTFEAPDALVQRQAGQIRSFEWNQYLIYREFSAGAWFDYDGWEFTTAPGDLVISDADTPFRTRALETYRHHCWLLPRHVLEPHLPRLNRPLVAHIPAASGVVAPVSAYLDALSAQLDRMGEIETGLIADNLGRLIAVACGGLAGDHRAAVGEARLARARRHIDANLASPDLGPATVAAALGMSVRQLHLVFEPSGEGVAACIRRHRLEACRAALESPLSAGRSVADIAFGWGFSSLPTFYRAFSQAFGMAPGDVRAAAQAA